MSHFKEYSDMKISVVFVVLNKESSCGGVDVGEATIMGNRDKAESLIDREGNLRRK